MNNIQKNDVYLKFQNYLNSKYKAQIILFYENEKLNNETQYKQLNSEIFIINKNWIEKWSDVVGYEKINLRPTI